jgi:peroxiredoxin
MQQIVDLHNDPEFQKLGVELLSIAFDSQEELKQGALESCITGVPLLTDVDKTVSEDYNVLQWAVESGEPSHTFVLVDKDGRIAWIKDYGAPNNPNRTMYVEPTELVSYIKASLK